MYREQVIFMDPYSKARFRSKSYTAYRLQDGINWSQLLRLGDIQSTRRQLALPEDVETPLGRFVQLPEVVKYADTTWAFSESPTLPDPCKDPITVIDAEGRQMLADMDNGVLYYSQGVEDNKVKMKAVPDVLVLVLQALWASFLQFDLIYVPHPKRQK